MSITQFVVGMTVFFSAETIKSYARSMHKLVQASEVRQAIGIAESDKISTIMEMLAQGDFKSAVAKAERTKHVLITGNADNIAVSVSQELMTAYAETSVKMLDVMLAVVNAMNAIKFIVRFSGIKEQFAKLNKMANEKLNPEKETVPAAKKVKRGTPVKKGQRSTGTTGPKVSVPALKVKITRKPAVPGTGDAN